MPTLNVKPDPFCKGCKYYSLTTPCCDFIAIRKVSRPCPPGEGCIVRKSRRGRRKKEQLVIKL